MPPSDQIERNVKRKREISTLASAPGKLILFGEHAVVHGQPAIAAALSDLRIHVTVTTRTDGLAHLDMPDLKPKPLLYHVPANSLVMKTSDEIQSIPLSKEGDINTFIKCHSPPTQSDTDFIRDLLLHNKNFPTELDDVHLSALIPLVYLINLLVPSLLTDASTGLSVNIVSSNLPVGAGLGSSAAFGVASSAALYKMHLQLNSNQELENIESPSVPQSPNSTQLDLINTLSYCSETLVHGTPSGIDNAVSTYGGAIYFTKHLNKDNGDGDGKTTVTMEKIKELPHMDVILTNTHVPRSTKELVKGVGIFKEEFPTVVNGMLDSIGGISRMFRSLITSKETVKKLSIQEQKQISKLIQTNQHLLCALGVSHPSLDAISTKTMTMYESHGCVTKLTGAGGGGCAFTFVEADGKTCNGTGSTLDAQDGVKGNDDEHEQRLKDVRETIEGLSTETTKNNVYNYKCFNSAVGGSGILWK